MSTPRKTCDVCKARKVRCITPSENDRNCTNCIRRGETCHFSNIKKRRKRFEIANTSALTPNTALSSEIPSLPSIQLRPSSQDQEIIESSIADSSVYDASDGLHIERSHSPPLIYLDLLLEDRTVAGRQSHELLFKRNERFVNSSSIAFFSESRVRSLNTRLGHARVQQILDSLEGYVKSRLSGTSGTREMMNFRRSQSPNIEDTSQLRNYIKSYFLHIHPVYPFLNRARFESRAFSPNLRQSLKVDKGWSALYFTVLALGCQYHGEGTFDQGKGKPWEYFQIALENLPDILIPMDNLINAQAMAAMAIFSLNFSCIEVLELLATEAARIALAMNLHQSVENAEAQRTFWVIYCIEKEFCFYVARESTISDFDIGCPVPDSPEDSFGNFNWLLCYVRYARILSKAYESLFSISATVSSTSDYGAKINRIRSQLDAWKDSIPLDFRPGQSVQRNDNFLPVSKYLTVKLHFSYYHTVIALSRLKLHVFKDGDEEMLLACKSDLMHSARCIIDLTQHIEMAHYTALWVMGTIPLVALFILFDFVIHNPHHPETKKNLAFLDIVAGYFTRLDFTSEGSIPGSLLAEFTHIARQFVQEIQSVPNNPVDNEIAQRNDSQIRPSIIGLSSPSITPNDPISQGFLTYPNMEHFGTTPEGHPGFDVSNLFGWSLAEFNITGFDAVMDSGSLD
ncbi:fungal-specific transcription factor domain-containing protein [Xylogone sp. PMI_703]|nr:fungal-specific transcription factor domain-containing protein [Xylogone sp. PMI_703]